MTIFDDLLKANKKKKNGGDDGRNTTGTTVQAQAQQQANAQTNKTGTAKRTSLTGTLAQKVAKVLAVDYGNYDNLSKSYNNSVNDIKKNGLKGINLGGNASVSTNSLNGLSNKITSDAKKYKENLSYKSGMSDAEQESISRSKGYSDKDIALAKTTHQANIDYYNRNPQNGFINYEKAVQRGGRDFASGLPIDSWMRYLPDKEQDIIDRTATDLKTGLLTHAQGKAGVAQAIGDLYGKATGDTDYADKVNKDLEYYQTLINQANAYNPNTIYDRTVTNFASNGLTGLETAAMGDLLNLPWDSSAREMVGRVNLGADAFGNAYGGVRSGLKGEDLRDNYGAALRYGLANAASEEAQEWFEPGSIAGANVFGLNNFRSEAIQEGLGGILDPYKELALNDYNNAWELLGDIASTAANPYFNDNGQFDLTNPKVKERLAGIGEQALEGGISGMVNGALMNPSETARQFGTDIDSVKAYFSDDVMGAIRSYESTFDKSMLAPIDDAITNYETADRLSFAKDIRQAGTDNDSLSENRYGDTNKEIQSFEQSAQNQFLTEQKNQALVTMNEFLKKGTLRSSIPEIRETAQRCNENIIRHTAQETGAKITKKELNALIKISNHLGIRFRFLENDFFVNSGGEYVIDKGTGVKNLINGEVLIPANPQKLSGETVSQTVYHEIMHVFEGTPYYTDLSNYLRGLFEEDPSIDTSGMHGTELFANLLSAVANPKKYANPALRDRISALMNYGTKNDKISSIIEPAMNQAKRVRPENLLVYDSTGEEQYTYRDTANRLFGDDYADITDEDVTGMIDGKPLPYDTRPNQKNPRQFRTYPLEAWKRAVAQDHGEYKQISRGIQKDISNYNDEEKIPERYSTDTIAKSKGGNKHLFDANGKYRGTLNNTYQLLQEEYKEAYESGDEDKTAYWAEIIEDIKKNGVDSDKLKELGYVVLDERDRNGKPINRKILSEEEGDAFYSAMDEIDKLNGTPEENMRASLRLLTPKAGQKYVETETREKATSFNEASSKLKEESGLPTGISNRLIEEIERKGEPNSYSVEDAVNSLMSHDKTLTEEQAKEKLNGFLKGHIDEARDRLGLNKKELSESDAQWERTGRKVAVSKDEKGNLVANIDQKEERTTKKVVGGKKTTGLTEEQRAQLEQERIDKALPMAKALTELGVDAKTAEEMAMNKASGKDYMNQEVVEKIMKEKNLDRAKATALIREAMTERVQEAVKEAPQTVEAEAPVEAPAETSVEAQQETAETPVEPIENAKTEESPIASDGQEISVSDRVRDSLMEKAMAESAAEQEELQKKKRQSERRKELREAKKNSDPYANMSLNDMMREFRGDDEFQSDEFKSYSKEQQAEIEEEINAVVDEIENPTKLTQKREQASNLNSTLALIYFRAGATEAHANALAKNIMETGKASGYADVLTDLKNKGMDETAAREFLTRTNKQAKKANYGPSEEVTLTDDMKIGEKEKPLYTEGSKSYNTKTGGLVKGKVTIANTSTREDVAKRAETVGEKQTTKEVADEIKKEIKKTAKKEKLTKEENVIAEEVAKQAVKEEVQNNNVTKEYTDSINKGIFNTLGSEDVSNNKTMERILNNEYLVKSSKTAKQIAEKYIKKPVIHDSDVMADSREWFNNLGINGASEWANVVLNRNISLPYTEVAHAEYALKEINAYALELEKEKRETKDEALKKQYDEAIEGLFGLMEPVQLVVKSQTSDAARTLRSMNDGSTTRSNSERILDIEREIAKLNKELEKKLKGKEITLNEELKKELIHSVTDEEIADVIEKIEEDVALQIPGTFKDKIHQWRMLCMLANPRTMIRNEIGNRMTAGMFRMNDATKAMLERIFIDESERTAAMKVSQEAKDFAKFVRESSRYTDEALTTDKININKARQKVGYFSNDWVGGRWINKASRFTAEKLNKSDIKWIGKRADSFLAQALTARGYTVTKQDNGGFTVQKDGKNITERELNGLMKAALQDAQEATFHDANVIADIINKAKEVPVLSEIVEITEPFVKTPANILNRSLEFSPAGLLKSITYDAAKVASGNMTANQMISNVSRGMTGTAIALLGMMLAKAGLLDISTPDDDDDYKTKYYKRNIFGQQDYALHIGDKYYSLDWALPAASPIIIGAELANAGFNVGDFAEANIKGLSAILNASYLQSLKNTIDDFSRGYNTDDDELTDTQRIQLGAVEAGKSIGTNLAGQMMPTLGGAINRTIYSNTKTTQSSNYFKSLVNRAAMNFPVAGPLILEDAINQKGEPVKNVGSKPIERAVINFALPPTVTKDIHEATDEKLVEDGGVPMSQSGLRYKIPYSELSDKQYTEVKKAYYSEYNKYVKEFVGEPDSKQRMAYDELGDYSKKGIYYKLNNLALSEAKATYYDKVANGEELYSEDQAVAKFLQNEGIDPYLFYEGKQNGLSAGKQQALYMAELYDNAGVYDKIRQKIKDGELTYEGAGLTEAVAAMDSADRLTAMDKYTAMYGGQSIVEFTNEYRKANTSEEAEKLKKERSDSYNASGTQYDGLLQSRAVSTGMTKEQYAKYMGIEGLKRETGGTISYTQQLKVAEAMMKDGTWDSYRQAYEDEKLNQDDLKKIHLNTTFLGWTDDAIEKAIEKMNNGEWVDVSEFKKQYKRQTGKSVTRSSSSGGGRGGSSRSGSSSSSTSTTTNKDLIKLFQKIVESAPSGKEINTSISKFNPNDTDLWDKIVNSEKSNVEKLRRELKL